jgi:type VI secretion system protein ImpK
MSDNPFTEPEDADRTIIRPAPGGRPATPPAPPLAPQRDTRPPSRPAAPPLAEGAETVTFGLSPLIVAAAPLLQLLGRLRNTYTQPDPGELRERAIQQVRVFERAARDAGVPMDQLRPAHYALCASLDDVVQNSPWGSGPGWTAHGLVATFHEETRAGERLFVLLDRLKQNPGNYLPVLELIYLCLSLGFQGQYRLSPRGPAELDRIREDLYTIIIRQRQALDPALSPHWLGVAAPYRPARLIVPSWVSGAAALAVIAALFIWISTSLNAASDDVFAQMLGAPLAHMPQIVRPEPVHLPPPPPPAAPDPLCAFLKPQVDQGLVTVVCDRATPIIRIRNAGMFASGSAAVASSYVRLLQRIGEALKMEKGAITVDGYTDNQPIHTVQFPSNFQLSQARADAARAIIAGALGDPGRVVAHGHADADPVASNATPTGRDQNRRIEVVLRRQG